MAKELFREKFLVELRQAYENKKKSKMNHKNSLLLQWIIEYLDNDMQWIRPSLPDQEWDDMANTRKELEEFLVSELQKNYYQLTRYKEALKNHILPIMDHVLVITAAGNDGKKLDNDSDGFFWPNTTIGVAAGCNNKDKYAQLCRFSNYGNSVINILAPGEFIPVMFPTKASDGSEIPKATYVSGTSVSAPLVAGIAALVAQCRPEASVKDIRKAIFENADVYEELQDLVECGRVLNVQKTISSMCKNQVAPNSEEPDILKDEL